MLQKIGIYLVIFLNTLIVKGQTKNSVLQLSMIRDSTETWGLPVLLVRKDSSAKAYCPCYAYTESNGKWTKENDSTYLISLTDTAKEKRYRIAEIDSQPTSGLTKLYFKNYKGELIHLIHLKPHQQNLIYHSNTEGKVLLLKPYNNYRYFIITEDYPKDTVLAILQEFSSKMQYTITLTEAKKVHTFYYYLRKEKELWAIYDVKTNERYAWFTENMRDPYEGK